VQNINNSPEKRIPPEEGAGLSATLTPREIHLCLKQIGLDKAPGLEGLTTYFLQSNREILGQHICREIQKAYEEARALAECMKANIVLIPKCPEPNSIGNTIYQLFNKIIANRFLPFLSRMIYEEQTKFIKGRHIADNTIMMKEVLHSLNDRGNWEKFNAIKADINKAFDTVE
jgi:Reverse transcriptase (RNA-dependent DNA polymerase)